MKIVKKIFNSAYKRKNTFFGSGFSVEKSYGCKWLIDWSNSVDKKMTFKLFEDEQISFFITGSKEQNKYIYALLYPFLRILSLFGPEPKGENGTNVSLLAKKSF